MGKSKSIHNPKLDEIVKAVTKQFGQGSVFTNDGDGIKAIPVIPTGSLTLDDAIGVGGYPRGRIVEIFGAESSGKTTLATIAAAQAQKQGGIAAYIDAEHAFDLAHAQELGVDIDNLLISQPESAENALQLIDFYLEHSFVDLLVLDSVAALVPEVELKGEIGEGQVAHVARMMSQAMRKIKGKANSANTVCIFINQTRQNINIKWGNPETTTGGTALKFYSSVRLRVSRGIELKSDDVMVGCMLKVKVVKNKVAPPFKVAEPYLYFSRGFDQVNERLANWVEMDIVEKAGSWYSYKGERIGQGLAKVSAFVSEHNLLETLEKEYKAKLEMVRNEGHKETDITEFSGAPEDND